MVVNLTFIGYFRKKSSKYHFKDVKLLTFLEDHHTIKLHYTGLITTHDLAHAVTIT